MKLVLIKRNNHKGKIGQRINIKVRINSERRLRHCKWSFINGHWPPRYLDIFTSRCSYWLALMFYIRVLFSSFRVTCDEATNQS